MTPPPSLMNSPDQRCLMLQISQKAREVVQHLDQYQLLFHRIREDIKLSNAVSLEIYFALRQLYDMVRSNVSNERDLLRITIAYYQSWFEHAVMFWLQTFRDEGIRRMEKALEIEKDVRELLVHIDILVM